MGRLWHLLCLMCLLCSRTGETAFAIDLAKEWPENGDPVAGDTVILRCEASDTQPSYIFEWTKLIVDSESLIARNGSLHNQRYKVFSSATPLRYEHLIIPKADRDSTGMYHCRVKNATLTGGTVILGDRSFYLSVLYFPSDVYPVCFPSGAFTALPGTMQLMKCTSALGNPSVQMDFTSSGQILPLDYERSASEQVTSLEIVLDASHNNLSFRCKITSPTYFAGRERSCTIGPVTVGQDTTRPLPLTSDRVSQPIDPALPTGEPDVMTAPMPIPTDGGVKNGSTSTDTSSSYPVALSAGVASVGAFLVLLFFVMIGVFACFAGRCKDGGGQRKYPPSDYSPNEDFVDIPSIVSYEENASTNNNIPPSFLLDDLSQGRPDTISTVEADDRMSQDGIYGHQHHQHHPRPGFPFRTNSSKELQKKGVLSGYDTPVAYRPSHESPGEHGEGPHQLSPGGGPWKEPTYSTLKKKNSLGRSSKKSPGAVGEDYRPAKSQDDANVEMESYPATLGPVVVKQVTWKKHVF